MPPDRSGNHIRYQLRFQLRLYFSGSFRRNSAFARYSATAPGVVIQFLPTLKARSRPFRARSRSWASLRPDKAAASVSEISRSFSNGPQAHGLGWGHYNAGLDSVKVNAAPEGPPTTETPHLGVLYFPSTIAQ